MNVPRDARIRYDAVNGVRQIVRGVGSRPHNREYESEQMVKKLPLVEIALGLERKELLKELVEIMKEDRGLFLSIERESGKTKREEWEGQLGLAFDVVDRAAEIEGAELFIEVRYKEAGREMTASYTHWSQADNPREKVFGEISDKIRTEGVATIGAVLPDVTNSSQWSEWPV